MAALAANLTKADRTYFIGAVAERKDGAIVISHNGWPLTKNALHHAESRLVRKLDTAKTVYVARLAKDGKRVLSRPCESCMIFLKSRKVQRVIYTISDSEYGVIYL